MPRVAANPAPRELAGWFGVNPPKGLPPVDREFYLMQGEFYLQGEPGQKGLRDLSLEKAWQETPDYVVYNSSVGALTGEHALNPKVGETIRFFFGAGGPEHDSAYHHAVVSSDASH